MEQNSLQAKKFLSEWALLVVHTYLQATFWGIADISGSVGVSKVESLREDQVKKIKISCFFAFD